MSTTRLRESGQIPRGYIFFQRRGYELVQKEVSYYLELEKFYIPADIQKHIMELESEGIRVAWFDSAGNFGYEEMFERLRTSRS